MLAELLRKDIAHADIIAMKQKHALEGANEVMKKQRCEIDDINSILQSKKNDLAHASGLVKRQQMAIEQLNKMVYSHLPDKARLEFEIVEYQEALATIMLRFQTEFGSLQHQLADLHTFSSV